MPLLFNLPTLFSRTSTGATQQWRIDVQGNQYRVSSGQIDGKQAVSEWTTCKGKNLGRANATTGDEQAMLEAQAKWDKKYKTGYTANITLIDECVSYIEPMLAKELDDYIDKIDFAKGVLVQNKYNGFRCVARLENGVVTLKSRKGELYLTVPHIIKDLEPFFRKYPNAVLDGELFNNQLRAKLNEMSKILRKTKNITQADLELSEAMVRFYVYDGFDFTDEHGPKVAYEVRKKWIDTNLPIHSQTYRHVPTTLVHSMAEVEELYAAFLADGQEGCMVRIVGSPYEVGKCSKLLLKYKPEDSAEALIKNIQEGTGNWAGVAKIITFDQNGKVFDGTLMGTKEQAAEILINKSDWIGKIVTFKYTGLTGKGIPNYARLDPDNCFEGTK